MNRPFPIREVRAEVIVFRECPVRQPYFDSMSILRVLFFRSLFLMPIMGVAQDTTCTLVIRGSVVDEHDQGPLSFAEVYIPALNKGAVADQQGRFVLSGLCAGRYLLRIAHLGCETVERIVQLDSDVDLRLELEHHAQELAEFEVARSRPDEHVGLPNEGVNKEAMEASGRSLVEMLSTINGVTVLQSGPTIGKPVIHGLSGNRVLILNQGIRQEDQQWGTEHAPGLDPFSSDRLTVVKGASSVQYGSDAMGGVVIIEPVELPRSEGVRGEVRGLGVANGKGGGGNVQLEGGVHGLRGFGWRLQGSARKLGDASAPGYVLSNTGMNEAATSAAIGYRDHRWNTTIFYSYFGRELGILRASHIGNLTDLQTAITNAQPWYVGEFTYAIDAPRQNSAHHLLKAEVGYAVGDRDRLVLTYARQADDRQEFDIRRAGRSAIPATDLSLITQSGDLVYKHWIGPHLHGKIGANGMEQENLNVPGTGIRPLIPNFRKRTGALFVLEHLPINDELELEAGVRSEAARIDVALYNAQDSLVRPVHRFTNHAFSLGANWSVTDSSRIRFNIGSAFRPPHVSELYSEGLHHGAAALEMGDDRLGSERSVKATVDLDGAWFGGRLRTNITLYTDRIDGYIYLRPNGAQLTIRGAFPVFDYIATDAFLYGSDLTVEWRSTDRFKWRSRASLVRGRDQVLNEWLFQMPADRMEHALVFSTTTHGKWRAIQISLTGQYVFRQSRVPNGVDYTDPPAAYDLFGLQASATRSAGKHELRMGVQLSNLLDRAYRDYMDRFRYYADARGMDAMLWLRYSFGRTEGDHRPLNE